VLLLACLGAALTVAGCAGTGTSTPLGYAQATSDAAQSMPSLRGLRSPYLLRSNDQLHIQVYNEPTITGDYAIDGMGSVSIPAAGHVKAAGLTVAELERRVTAQLNHGILKNALVSIQVTTYAPFYIRGEVKKPGEFPYKPGLTVADAVALAGGYTYRADESAAYVRPAGAGAEIARPLGTNPPVSPGDNIRIAERFF
ncbi:MAG: polysaccharide biosynthesis/export family protein, partial [Candidatus Binataceae bacterium]